MEGRSLENSKAAWVLQDDGSFVLHWLKTDTTPALPDEPCGVDREMDLPGRHGLPLNTRRQARTVEQQLAEMWPEQ